MKGLLCLLLLLAGLAALHPQPVQEQEPEVLGYWLHADGRVTEFRRGPDRLFHSYRGRATCH